MGSMCSSGSISKLSENCTIRKSSSLDSSKYLQLKHFQYISTLGEGSFGKVILVRKKSNQTLYAIKLINTDKLRDLRRLEYTRFERHVLAEFQNPFIVKLRHLFESSGKLCVVLDFMQGGSLAFHLNKLGRFKPDLAVFFASEILIALEMLHKREFLYSNLKPENILLDCEGHCRLTDFNLSALIDEMSSNAGGGAEYAAPEVLQGLIQTIEADFWGFGVIIYHMLQGITPFFDNNYQGICKNILVGRYQFTENFSKEAMDLISKLLVVDPKDRLTDYKIIKKHQFFAEIDWEATEAKDTISPLKLKFKDSCDLRYFPAKRYPIIACKDEACEDANKSYSSYEDLSYNSELVN